MLIRVEDPSSTFNAACIIDKHTEMQGGRFMISVLSWIKLKLYKALFSVVGRGHDDGQNALRSAVLLERMGLEIFQMFSGSSWEKSSGLSLADPALLQSSCIARESDFSHQDCVPCL